MTKHQQNNDKKLYQTLKAIRKSLLNQPRNIELIFKKGYVLYLLKKYKMAADAFTQALEIKPDFAQAYNARSIVNHELRNYCDAISDCEQALNINPSYKEAFYNLARSQQKLNQLDNAIDSYTQAISLDQKYFNGFLGRAEAWKAQNNHEKALNDLSNAAKLNPSSTTALLNRGVILSGLGRFEEAIVDYKKAINLEPNFAEAHGNLGNTLQQLGKIKEAKASISRSIALNPAQAQAHLYFCELLEKTNNIDELFLALDKARAKTTEMAADFLFYEAIANFRKDRCVEAINLVNQISESDVSDVRKAMYHKLKGDLYDQTGDFDRAFLAYEASNQAVEIKDNFKQHESVAQQLYNTQKSMLKQLRKVSENKPYIKKWSVSPRNLSFLIGFPRSGTTLLDMIIRSHSKIDIMDNEYFRAKTLSILDKFQKLPLVEQINAATAKTANDIYFQELQRHTELSEKSKIIEKILLNFHEVPAISQIFPDAKYILAIRHPFDCILSCWMQIFGSNSAMATLVNLDHIVDYYCTSMEFFTLSKNRYHLDVHNVRYEDLVKNFKGEVSGIIKFLNLDWEEALLEYQSTALSQEKISTPSHSQVIKPIYKTASYRWRNYRKHLVGFEKRLSPWINEYGY